MTTGCSRLRAHAAAPSRTRPHRPTWLSPRSPALGGSRMGISTLPWGGPDRLEIACILFFFLRTPPRAKNIDLICLSRLRPAWPKAAGRHKAPFKSLIEGGGGVEGARKFPSAEIIWGGGAWPRGGRVAAGGAHGGVPGGLEGRDPGRGAAGGGAAGMRGGGAVRGARVRVHNGSTRGEGGHRGHQAGVRAGRGSVLSDRG